MRAFARTARSQRPRGQAEPAGRSRAGATSGSRASAALPAPEDRSELLAQPSIQALADGSPQVHYAASVQAIADRSAGPALQRQSLPEEEPETAPEEKGVLQGRFGQGGLGQGGLPPALRAGLEHLSGIALSDVRVHYNSARPARVEAQAYTQGCDIHLGPGQERHLSHEGWHAVQQKQGRVRRTGRIAGMALNDDPRLEREADRMGRRAERRGAERMVVERTGAASDAGRARSGAAGGRAGSVMQAFWVRSRDRDEVNWKEDKFWFTDWYERSQTERREQVSAGKKTSRMKWRTYYEDESRFTPSSLGWLPVYLVKPQIASRLDELDDWLDRLGAQKGAAVFGSYDMRQGSDRRLIRKHMANLEKMDESVVERLMRRRKKDLDSFLDDLDADELMVYFQGSLSQQQALVDSDEEFRGLVGLMGSERRFAHGQVLGMSPTASQGAHYLSEHGAHSSVFQTIERAVSYNLRGGGATTKGNWVSNEVQDAAMEWAKRRAALSVKQARDANSQALSGPARAVIAAGDAPIFGQAGTQTARIDQNVGQILAQGDYEHGDVAGWSGNAEADIDGDFMPESGVLENAAFGGKIKGKLTGAALAKNVTAANQALRILDVTGNGNVQVDADATAQANNQLAGTIIGRMSVPNAQVSLTLGAGPTTRYLDGTGDYRGMVSAAINGAQSSWVSSTWNRTVDGQVWQQTLNDGCNNSVSVRRAALQGPLAGMIYGQGSVLQGSSQVYTPGTRREINTAGASKAQNLQADVIVKKTGWTFNPQSLSDIVTHARTTARTSTYKRSGLAASVTGQLLRPSIMITGRLVDLQTGGKFGAVNDLSGLNLQVDNVTRGEPWFRSDIARVANPVAGTYYKIQIGGEWYGFRLAAFSTAPGQRSFRVLLYLKDRDIAEYEPFTAYPVP